MKERAFFSEAFGKEGVGERLPSVRKSAAHRLDPQLSPPGEPEDDHSLLVRGAGGDEAAVRSLYRRHVSRVHRHVARVLGSGDPDVEDVVQRVFLAALDGAGSFDGRGSVGGWLVGIAARKAIDAVRARSRRRRFRGLREWVGLGRPAAAPDMRLSVTSQAELALATLKPEQRTVFLLHDVEGHTLAEIAEMTGARVSTLHARLQAARRRLTALVETWTEGNDGTA